MSIADHSFPSSIAYISYVIAELSESMVAVNIADDTPEALKGS